MNPPTVFWSWQNDFAPNSCRHFIREALVAATSAAGDSLGLQDAERPEVDHDTQKSRGMVDIVDTIFDKITNCAVFVADVTPIGTSEEGKALPNPNVLVELGWAMKSVGPDRIIAVLNGASGFKPEDLPFDIRQRRILVYDLAQPASPSVRKAAERRLVGSLTDALTLNLQAHVEDLDAVQEVMGVPTAPYDPSVWMTSGNAIHFHEYPGPSGSRSVGFPSCPRAYMRIIPSSWTDKPPSIHDIKSVSEAEAVQAPSGGYSYGSFGPCEEGFVRFWITGRQGEIDESANVTMYFDETGEFWVVYGTAIGTQRGHPALRHEAVLRSWHETMKRSFAIFEKFGARATCKVEAGLFNVKGVAWPGEWESESPRARRNACKFVRQSRDWSAEAQKKFLWRAHSEITNLFGWPAPSRASVDAMLRSM